MLSACDLCYSRKVKCDRQEICANCVDAGVECRRNRPKAPSKPKASSGISYLEERLSNLERLTTQSRGNSHSPNVPNATHGVQNDMYESDKEAPHKKRKLDDRAARSKSVPQGHAEWTNASEDSSHRAKQAKAILQNELSINNDLNSERWTILRSALNLVENVASRKNLELGGSSPTRMPDSHYRDIDIPDAPPPELLYMLLREQSPTLNVGKYTQIQWPDHVTGRSLEAMVTRLLYGDAHGQTYHQLCICVYVKAVFHLDQLSRLSTNTSLTKQFLTSKRVYVAAAMRALGEIDVCSTPSLTLVQSLMSGAHLMQQLGKMNQCWVLNSYAARLIVSLNYHEIEDRTPNNEAVLSVVFWCYYLDRTLSALFLRPMSLPEPCLAPSQLIQVDPSMAYGPVIGIISDLAQVQGELLDISLNGKRRYTTEISARCEHLQSRMRQIHSKMESANASIMDAISNEWHATDFCYNAILVDVLRARLKHDPSAKAYKECLSAARASLRAFQLLKKNPAYVPGIEDSYPSFLTWTVFLYPLSPFFVLFCNVVRTADFSDYLLLQEVTEGLSQFTGNTHVAKMLDLLTALQLLCEPLFQPTLSQNQQDPPVSATHHTMDSLPYQVLAPNAVDGVGGVQPEGFSAMEPSDSQILTSGTPPGSSADGLMWQLFNSQLPLGWFDLDMSPFNGH